MSHHLNISEALRRPIQNGTSFSAYIKETNCKAFSYGNGNNSTIEGVEYMADMIKKSSYQVKKLADKLKKSTLQATVNSVHKFLTTYIQYDADAQLQKLRSPGCAWSVRSTGIDCKSFSIFAGALLSEMDISFVIRQVKQPGFYPDQFTHVYVVVPKNQKLTSVNNLNSYHNLDATVLGNKEVVFIAKKDKLMSGLPYQGMMAPGVSNQNQKSVKETTEATNFERSFAQFEKLGFSRSDLQKMKGYMKKLQANTASSSRVYMLPKPNGLLLTNGRSGFVFKPARPQAWSSYYGKYANSKGLNAVGVLTAVTGISTLLKGGNIGDIFGDTFGNLSDLIGGLFGSDRGWYKPDYVKRDAEMLIGMLQKHVQKINTSVQSKNMSGVGNGIADFKNEINVFLKAAQTKRSEGWNDPTMDNLKLLIDGLQKLKGKFIPKLDSWISQHFNVRGTAGSKTKRSSEYDSLNTGSSPVFLEGNIQSHTTAIPNLSIKPGIGSVQSFDLSGSGQIILQVTPAQPATNPTNPTTPTTSYPGSNYTGGAAPTETIDQGVQKASLIPGFSNTALFATGGSVVAGILLWPTIKKAIK